MVRAGFRYSPGISVLAAVVAVAGFASAPAWAAKAGTPGAAASGANASSHSSAVASESDDAQDKASRLTVRSDFNRDGIADIAAIILPAGDHTGPAFLTVSLRRPDGTFKQISSRPVLGHNPRDIVAGDFNQDGIPDLIIGDGDGTLMLLLGDGKGNMVSAGDVARLSSVVSIAVADFNHDGILDLAVSDWRASSVTILLGIGKGSLQARWSFPLRMAGTTPHLAVADFNGDGIPDLAVVYDDDQEDTFDVMLGNGNGTFNKAPDLGLTRDPNAHCVT